MGLARPIVWLLVVVWLASFVCFVVVSQLAFVSGTNFEYRLYGIQFPYVAFALLACMTASSGLLWANYRGVDFSGAVFNDLTIRLILTARLQNGGGPVR
jgi:hypothetical protein